MKCLTPRELLAKNLSCLGIVYMYPLKKKKKKTCCNTGQVVDKGSSRPNNYLQQMNSN